MVTQHKVTRQHAPCAHNEKSEAAVALPQRALLALFTYFPPELLLRLARARQRVLRSLGEVTRARAMPALAPASNAYGVALDDLLVEQCANLANVRHFFLPELHPPRALLGIRDRPLELVRMHRVQEDDDADFLRAWVDGGAITTARAAAKKIAGDLFTQFARRRRDN